MKIAIAGCVHGELDTVYDDIQRLQSLQNMTVDLLIICGDLQTIRNHYDMQCVALPRKHRKLGNFYKYYSAQLCSPVLTLFVGGNYEASNYLSTLPYGGWVAHNIYYLGYSSVVNINGLRIAGVSGIYHRDHSRMGHFEHLPYDSHTMRSVYHVRDVEIHRLLQLKHSNDPLDIIVSHDWPLNIHNHGDSGRLMGIKPHLGTDIRNDSLGNPLHRCLLDCLRPRYWFSAHLHVRFDATVDHLGGPLQTRFLALDKCSPGRQYLEVLDIQPERDCRGGLYLEYDPEYLCILRSTNHLLSVDKYPYTSAAHAYPDCVVSKEQLQEVIDMFDGDLTIPTNFSMSEPVLGTTDLDPQRINNYTNPQTTELCNKLGITDPVAAIIGKLGLNDTNKDRLHPCIE